MKAPSAQELRDKIYDWLNQGLFLPLSVKMLSDVVCQDRQFVVVFSVPASLAGELEGARIKLEEKIRSIKGIKTGRVILSATASENDVQSQPHAELASKTPSPKLSVTAKNVIAVASGKGGVGKSTVAVNLAAALVAAGQKVGLLDADIYGPSVPLLLGYKGATITQNPETGKLIPPCLYGIHAVSIGMLVEDGRALVWRGPMVQKALVQLIRDVDWPELDTLVLDLPPGTGDAQLTIAQKLDVSGALIVTTPQAVALSDVTRGIAMFEKTNVPVLGIVENMAGFLCPDNGKMYEIFPRSRLQDVSRETRAPILVSLPLSPDLAQSCDQGKPLCAVLPQHEISQIYSQLARHIIKYFESQAGHLQSFAG